MFCLSRKRDITWPFPSDSDFCSSLTLNLFSNTHKLLFSTSCPLYSTPFCSTPPLSLYIVPSIFFLPAALQLPTSPRFYLLNRRCFLKTLVHSSAAESHCVDKVWFFTVILPIKRTSSTFFKVTQGGLMFLTVLKRVRSDFIPWANFRMSFSVLSPSTSLTYISPGVPVFHKNMLVKGVSHSTHRRRIKVSISFLPIFSCS